MAKFLTDAYKYPNLSYRQDIDGLRTLAIFLYFLFHFGSKDYVAANYTPPIGGAFLCADIFFVVSGYLITRQIVSAIKHKEKFSIYDYIVRRAKRIFPLLVTVLSFITAINYFVLSPNKYYNYAKDQISALLYHANYKFLFDTGYFKADHQDRLLNHTWSLSIEEHYYIFMPLFLLLVSKIWGIKKAFVATFIISFVSFALYLFYYNYHNLVDLTLYDPLTPIYFSSTLRFYEFGLGGLASFFTLETNRKYIKEVIVTILLGLLLYLVITGQSKNYLMNHYQSYASLITAFILLVPNNKISNTLLSNKFTSFIGKRTYSFYLLWTPLIVLASYILVESLELWMKLVVFVIFFFIALLFYKFIEHPFRYRFKNITVFSYVMILGLGLFSFTYYLTINHGHGVRLPIDMLEKYKSKDYLKNSINGGMGCEYGCQINRNGEKTIFLVGDSLSTQMKDGMAKKFPNYNIEIFNRGVCGFFSADWVTNMGQHKFRDCQAETQSLIDRINKTKPYLIIFRRWREKTSVIPIDDLSGSQKSFYSSRQPEKYKKFFAEQIDQLKEKLNIENLLVISNPPSLPKELNSLDECILSPIRKHYMPRQCDRFSPLEEALNSTTFMRDFGGYIKTVQVLDPFEAFCSESKCQLFSEEGYYYSDSIHFSYLGSLVFLNHFEKEFLNFLQN